MYKYKAIKINGVKHDYHRWIMEQKLGRKLKRNEVVHHLDGDSKNNDIDNLSVMSLSDHSRSHRLGKKTSTETKEKISLANIGKPSGTPRKFTDEQIRYIKENYIPRDRKFGARALSKKFGTHHSTIEHIIHEKTYRDVDHTGA